jgi:type IV secretory pathway protease TraF
MQCPSCQFENMPGAPRCGRCGGQLQLAAAPLDVNPPRASARAKQFRRWFPSYRYAAELRGAVTKLSGAMSPEFDWDRLPAAVFLRMAVPGWPQRYLGQPRRGRFMLQLYLVLLSVGVLSIGTSFGSLLLGTALAVHISSIMDVLWPLAQGWRTRMVVSAACVAVVGALVYAPVVWAASQVVGVRTITMAAGPLHAGDAILYRPGGSPDVGDVVLYEITPGTVQTRTAGGYAAQYVVMGEQIDRIIAGPGQSVTWKRPQLLVDGQPSRWQPLDPAAVDADLQFTVPPGYYGILPSTRPQNAPHYPPEVWQAMSLVPQDNIRGPVVLRHQPIWRWGPL